MSEFDDIPESLTTKSEASEQEWLLVPEFFAQEVAANKKLETELLRVSPHVAICSRSPETKVDGNALPVYRAGKQGPIAVASGRIFIRFSPDIKLADMEEALNELGYKIDEVSETGENAGWLWHHSKSCSDSLNNFPKLRGLKEVDAVEPQFIMQRQSKSVPRRS